MPVPREGIEPSAPGKVSKLVRVGVLGAGYWGSNLIRNFSTVPNGMLAAVCEMDPALRNRVGAQYPAVATLSDYQEMLDDRSLDAVVVATPVEHHYAHARAALEAGKHVMVEKPLATTSRHCLELIRLADQRGLVLMAGHTFLYNAAVRKVKELVSAGELGQVLYLYFQRLNLGILRRDVDAMWNLAPHDISIANYLVGEDPVRVTARGFPYLQQGLADVVFLTVDYPSGAAANIHVSWLDPQKVRKMTLVGSRKMVVYDDVSPDAKVQVYDKGFDRVAPVRGPGAEPALVDYRLHARDGEMSVAPIEWMEPLRTECSHFVDCIRQGARPLSDGWNGLQVVSVLEAATQSMAQGGRPVEAVEASRPGR